MPSEAEVKAALKAIWERGSHPSLETVTAGLEAAERVRLLERQRTVERDIPPLVDPQHW